MIINSFRFGKAVPTGPATYYATSSVSGSVSGPANALGAPDGTFTTDSGSADWTHRWQIAGVPAAVPNGSQNLTLHMRKNDAGGGDASLTSVAIYHGGSLHHSDTTGWMPGDGVLNVPISFPATPTNTIDVELVTAGGGGGPNQRTMQIDAMTWDATVELEV